MKYTITTGDCADISTDCLVVGVYAGSKLTPSAIAVDQASGGLLKRLAKRGDPCRTCIWTLVAAAPAPVTAKPYNPAVLWFDRQRRHCNELAPPMRL